MIDQSRVWVIRAHDGLWAEEFAENGYIGLDHGMDGVDMSGVRTSDEVRRLFIQEHPGERNERSIGNRASQVYKFHLEIKSGDYVLTPGIGDEIRYGRFSTDDCYYVSNCDGLPTRNRRFVEWSPKRLNRRDLPRRVLQGGTTLYEVGDTSGLREFLVPIEKLVDPNVWIVRGGRDGVAIDEFLNGGYTGVGFSFTDFDVTICRTEEELLRFCERHGLKTEGLDQVARFLSEVRIHDYVLMPGPRSTFSHYGQVTSAPYHDENGTHNNRRNVEWSENTITRAELDLSGYQQTVTRPNQSVRDRFLEIIRNGPVRPPVHPYTIDDMIAEGVFFERGELMRILDRFREKKNLILQGTPGVGKTFVSRRLAYALMGERADDRIVNVQFHQSYSYEEFVRGYRPSTNVNDELKFELQDGTFLRLCEMARRNPDDRYVMIIDEINRGNLSRVFGELLSLIENDKRGDGFSVELVGGGEFSVPENVYLLGTMNLADRSLAGVDYAMRRRFGFVTLEPQFGESVFVDWLSERGVPGAMIERINSGMLALNDVIGSDPSLGRNFAVGHSYFCGVGSRLRGNDGEGWDVWYREIVETEIRPLLEEYWFDDVGKADAEVGRLLDEQE